MNNFPPYPSYQAPGVKWRRKAGVLGVTVDGKPDVMALEKESEGLEEIIGGKIL